MPNHLKFSTDQNEINHVGNVLKVGEEILLNMTAHMEAKKKQWREMHKASLGYVIKEEDRGGLEGRE